MPGAGEAPPILDFSSTIGLVLLIFQRSNAF